MQLPAVLIEGGSYGEIKCIEFNSERFPLIYTAQTSVEQFLWGAVRKKYHAWQV